MYRTALLTAALLLAGCGGASQPVYRAEASNTHSSHIGVASDKAGNPQLYGSAGVSAGVSGVH